MVFIVEGEVGEHHSDLLHFTRDMGSAGGGHKAPWRNICKYPDPWRTTAPVEIPRSSREVGAPRSADTSPRGFLYMSRHVGSSGDQSTAVNFYVN